MPPRESDGLCLATFHPAIRDAPRARRIMIDLVRHAIAADDDAAIGIFPGPKDARGMARWPVALVGARA
jgi:hypothetical protein